ncbi:MAG: hypothetical protein HN458_05605 [Euryarchaeota archaeon]|jgi:hypothetical protein|nr:hypothetical protein [Euryarchaeota archaeon]
MGESHEATIQWVGAAPIAQLILAAAQRPHCESFSQDSEGQIHVSVVIHHSNLQQLRDIADALLIDFAEIEENN